MLIEKMDILVVDALARQRERLKNPPIDVDNFLQKLKQQGLIQTVQMLEAFKNAL